jgi:thiosulfate/3-mercaptopyruvate sulfurtransferase
VGRPWGAAEASGDGVLGVLSDPGWRLVDARSPERFRGDVEPLDPVAGHVPGAVNAYYQDNVGPDGAFLPVDELRARWTRTLDGRAPARCVCYCGSGVTACHNLLALEHAGLGGASLYVGSWSEWSAHPERPVERGDSDGTGATT